MPLERSSPPRSSTTVLIVEDSAIMRRVLQRFLQSDVSYIAEAETGTQGLELAASLSPDAILLDLNLPEVSGLEVCRRLRERPETAHTPIIVVTAIASQEALRAAMDAGASDFLVKPISPAQLRTRVRKWLPGWETVPAHLVVGSTRQGF